jgi:hypothetical protein
MTSPEDETLDPELPDAERDELKATASLLERSRPTPRPGFREKLAERLQRKLTDWRQLHETAGLLKNSRPVPSPGFERQLARQMSGGLVVPERSRVLIGAYAGLGLLLLTIVALGLAGAGPLASG